MSDYNDPTAVRDKTRYHEALRNGMHGTCLVIEQKYGLFGYPPELVSVGLQAAADGRDVQVAVAHYVSGGAA